MLGVYNKLIAVGELAVEIHAGLHGGHFFHSAHVFVLREDDWLVVLAESLKLNGECRFLDLTGVVLEELRENGRVDGRESGGLTVALTYKVVDDIGVYAHKLGILEFALKE